MATRNEEPETATALLLASAWWARWRAPELSVALARHAEQQTEDRATRAGLRAVVASASFRLGDSRAVLPGAVAAMHAVEAAGTAPSGAVAGRALATALRVDIAGCAASVGLPRSAFLVLRPVFADGLPVPPATRAAALVRLVRALSGYGRRAELDEALRAADELYAAETELHQETVAALRGLLRAVTAARCRRLGDAAGAVEAAGAGLRLLPASGTLAADGLHARARLTLELAGALLDRGEHEAALRFAAPLLDVPVRAQDGAAVGGLRLSLADRLHRQRGELSRAGELLREAAAIAQRHRRQHLLAAAKESLAELGEATGDLEESLECLRHARAARAASAASYQYARRVVGTEFPERGSVDDLFALLREWSTGVRENDRGAAPETGPSQRREPDPADAPTRQPAAAGAALEIGAPGTEPASHGPRRGRHGAGSSRYLAVSAVPGLVVAEGSGGRRRAPEGDDEHGLPERPPPAPPSHAANRFAAPGGGRHGARDIGARVAAPRQRSSSDRSTPRQARHAAAEDCEPPVEATTLDRGSADHTAEPRHDGPVGPDTEPVETSPEEFPQLDTAVLAVDRTDLGLADLLAEALVAFRDTDRESLGERSSG